MGHLGTSANVTAMGLLGTSGVVEDMGFLGTSANVTAMGHLGTSANVTAMGLLGTSGVVEDMGFLGTSANVTAMSNLGTSTNVTNMANLNASGVISNISTVAGAVSNVNTVATNISGVNSFADRYRVSSSAPTSSLDVGDLYFDTTANELKVYKSSGWSAAGSTVNGTSARFHYNISGTPSSVTGADANGNTLAYDAGFADVYVNGVRMSPDDITITSGTSVAFASALADGDDVDIVAFGTFNVANIVSTGALNTGSITSGFGNIDTGSSTITTTGAISGGTLTGTLQTASQTNITGVGALNAGSITSGFGAIDNGSSAITTTGVGTFGSLDISGDIDVDGTANLDVVDIDGAVDMATTLTVAGNVDFNGDLDVDGTTNLDVVDIDGAVDMASTLSVSDNLTVDSGVLLVDATNNKIRYTKGTNVGLVIQDAGIANTVEIGFGTANELIQAGIITGSSIGFYTGTAGQGSATKKMEIDVNGIVTMPQQPAFIAYNNSNNNHTFSATETYEQLAFNIEVIDKNADFASSTFTAPVDGTYFVATNQLFNASSGGEIRHDLGIYVNSTLTLYKQEKGDNYAIPKTITLSGLVDLDASDTVKIYSRVSDTKGRIYVSQTTSTFHGYLIA